MMDMFAQIYWHEVDQQGDPVFCDAEINQRQLWPPSPSPKPKTYNAIGGGGEGGREEEGLFAQRIIACNPEFVQRQGVHYCATSVIRYSFGGGTTNVVSPNHPRVSCANTRSVTIVHVCKADDAPGSKIGRPYFPTAHFGNKEDTLRYHPRSHLPR